MSGIIHKESLPGQGLIKRRRLDAQPASEDQLEAKEEEPKVATTESAGHSGDATHLPPASGTRTAQSESGSSSSSDDDDDDEIERENARLAKLREQRNRRQQTQAASGSSSNGNGNAAATAATAGGSSGEAERTNSYDHDVLFRNAAWRNPTKAATPAEKRKQKWDSVLNRTQDSAAYSHFMKNFFK